MIKKSKKNQFQNSLEKIKKLYLKNNWHSSVGATRSENFFCKKNKIFKLLNLDKKKPTAVIFLIIYFGMAHFFMVKKLSQLIETGLLKQLKLQIKIKILIGL